MKRNPGVFSSRITLRFIRATFLSRYVFRFRSSAKRNRGTAPRYATVPVLTRGRRRVFTSVESEERLPVVQLRKRRHGRRRRDKTVKHLTRAGRPPALVIKASGKITDAPSRDDRRGSICRRRDSGAREFHVSLTGVASKTSPNRRACPNISCC